MTTQPNGIFLNVSREDYDRSPGVNFSTLKVIARSPAHYRQKLIKPDADTAPRKLGRCSHIASFEPEQYGSRVAVWKGGKRNSNAWKAWKAKHDGLEQLSEKEHTLCMAVQLAVRNDPCAAKYVSGGKGEVSLYWTHVSPPVGEVAGYQFQCKARPDFLANVGAVVDLKTTRDASPEGFGRECVKYGYHKQAAYYRDAHEALTGERWPYKIIAVEPSEPYVVTVFTIPEYILDLGREAYRAMLDRLNFCRALATYPGYAEGEVELALPRWATQTSDEDAGGLDLDFDTEAGEEANA